MGRSLSTAFPRPSVSFQSKTPRHPDTSYNLREKKKTRRGVRPSVRTAFEPNRTHPEPNLASGSGPGAVGRTKPKSGSRFGLKSSRTEPNRTSASLAIATPAIPAPTRSSRATVLGTRSHGIRHLDALFTCDCGNGVTEEEKTGGWAVQCANRGCETQWFHLQCLDLDFTPAKWRCDSCKSSAKESTAKRARKN
ncbi:hypothetical protein SISNIDRAFT_471647 [Sistotremastrum niveocremeum HHB9708]|uniref:Zinc finger PHD-type domain-containing protein n=1 Tax=Sistotremastrum niveocremeum HHB9708 TaxID=1314777 RepID=A0A164MDX6_9AGAM|nr:hypothetical protein SISNIDRAFT_471647 [Sistotremastrum niveocremeum HHB9708]